MTDHFNKAAPHYNEAPKKSGFDENIKYQANWKKEIEVNNLVQPPYSANVKNSVGKLFMRLISTSPVIINFINSSTAITLS